MNGHDEYAAMFLPAASAQQLHQVLNNKYPPRVTPGVTLLHKILSLFTVFLSLLLLCACQLDRGILTLPEARTYLSTPESVSRGVDYLGSDTEFHYFEHKRATARNVRFRISCAEGIYAPYETMPYHRWFPERRDAYTALMGLHLTIHPDFSCSVEGCTYSNPAAVPAEIRAEVGTVHLTDKRLNKMKQWEQYLAPYRKNIPAVRFSYPCSGLVPQPMQQTLRRGGVTCEALDALHKAPRK